MDCECYVAFGRLEYILIKRTCFSSGQSLSLTKGAASSGCILPTTCLTGCRKSNLPPNFLHPLVLNAHQRLKTLSIVEERLIIFLLVFLKATDPYSCAPLSTAYLLPLQSTSVPGECASGIETALTHCTDGALLQRLGGLTGRKAATLFCGT